MPCRASTSATGVLIGRRVGPQSARYGRAVADADASEAGLPIEPRRAAACAIGSYAYMYIVSRRRVRGQAARLSSRSIINVLVRGARSRERLAGYRTQCRPSSSLGRRISLESGRAVVV
ncbi:hypothetical protein BD309DRAFT_962758 [Dichomitus squalens]|nr:hypothetical protein BD309DRAFT_962758 [Dichomitus squalens]